MPGIDTHIAAIEASHNVAANQGLDAAAVKAHNDLLTSHRGTAALELNSISTRPDLQALMKVMDGRIAALETALKTESVADKKVAMERTMAALRALRQQIADRENAVISPFERVAEATSAAYGSFDTFTRTNLGTTDTAGSVARTGLVVAAGVGIVAMGRRFINWIRGRSPAEAAPTVAPARTS